MKLLKQFLFCMNFRLEVQYTAPHVQTSFNIDSLTISLAYKDFLLIYKYKFMFHFCSILVYA